VDLRKCAREASKAALAARCNGDLDNAPIYLGQDAGLIDSIELAGEFIQEMVAEAEEIIKSASRHCFDRSCSRFICRVHRRNSF
jgi:NAD(P)H-dependent flavin oxidoreductase YrpB (nitropropane dioxygenase family)